jgi:ATP-dependent protease HslVU (ClpYQ) peptidase subunit
MKYLAFGYIFNHQDGGMQDLKGVFDTSGEAIVQVERSAKENLRDCTYLGEVVQVDGDNLTIIAHYEGRSSRDFQIDSYRWLSHAEWQAEDPIFRKGFLVMTCLIGVEHDGVVYMGADSITLSGWSKDIIAGQKIFKHSGLIFAFGGNPRMAQIIKYLTPLPHFLKPSQVTRSDDEAVVVMHVIEPIRKALKEHGYTSSENGQEQGASFLVGFNGKVWSVDNAFQLHRSSRKMCAMGVGDDHALGALYATLERYREWDADIVEGAILQSVDDCCGTEQRRGGAVRGGEADGRGIERDRAGIFSGNIEEV